MTWSGTKPGIFGPFDHEETRHFPETCRECFPDDYPFFLCAFSTGLRLGELLALEWSDIDWYRKRMEVSKSFGRQRIERPKNKKNRWVDISDHLFPVLRDLHTQRKREALEAGTGEAMAVIFHRGGKHFPQNSIRHIFNRVLAKAGLRKIRFHDIRHTYISLLISSGAKLNYVMEQAGHHSIKMTVDRYADYIPSGETSEVNLLDFVGGKGDERVFVRGE